MADDEKEVEVSDVVEAIQKITGREPAWENKLVYDSSAETLEPVYFWILDFARTLKLDDVEKLIDNFVASPGSGYFSELGAKATKMQEEAMKILGTVNTVIKSIVNVIYDLKEYEIRLSEYDKAKSENKEEKQAGVLALKQKWMDNVDIKRGRGSINQMTYELNFSTLRDAFMHMDELGDADKLDINDRVKRILKPRFAEFLEWKERSEKELRKRYNIEKTYLKSQVKSLKLYARWAKPYLKTAEQLRMKSSALTQADLVTAFNTMVLELAILAKASPVDVVDAAQNKDLPEKFISLQERGKIRNYHPCVFIDFKFRGIPRRISQRGDYAHGGRVEVQFKAFALNDEELKAFHKEIEKQDMQMILGLVSGITDETLAQLADDIAAYDVPEKEEEKEVNPFTALFSFMKKPQKETKKEEKPAEEEILRPDSFAEFIVRQMAEKSAAERCYKIFNIYKKAHGMASIHENPFERPEILEKEKWEGLGKSYDKKQKK